MAESIANKVAIIGMGCTRFGERWDTDQEDLVIDAAYEAYEDAGIEPKDIQAAWIGTFHGHTGSGTLILPLKLGSIPVVRVENACGSGHEALRNACYALIAKAFDLVLAIGYEKLKDAGFAGLGMARGVDKDHPTYSYGLTPPGVFALQATRYFAKYGLSPEEGKTILAKISVKSHYYGARNPKAHLRREITVEQALKAPMIAWPLGIFDCCGVTDGAAAAILCRVEDAKRFRDDYVVFKGFGASTGPGTGRILASYDWTWSDETEAAGKQAYRDAGVTNPREQLDLVELHDCFSIAELVNSESLLLCDRGKYKEQFSDTNAYYLDGGMPVNISGGLKSFGHPIGASGCRETYEGYKQIQGKAQEPSRQLKKWKTEERLCVAHNQGGGPGKYACNVTIIGLP